MASPGMSVPGASSLMGPMAADPADLETEQERRKRILSQQQSKLLPAAGASSLMGTEGAGYGTSLGGM